MHHRIANVLLPLQDLLLEPAPLPPSVGTFVKGINLGGEALTIAGDGWESYATALEQGLRIPQSSTALIAMAPQPYVDRAMRQMLSTVIFNPETLTLQQSLANGHYHLYLWMLENYRSYWHKLDIRLQGELVATGVGHLPLRHWVRAGAFPVQVTQGVLEIAITTNSPAVDAHLMGVSIFQPNSEQGEVS